MQDRMITDDSLVTDAYRKKVFFKYEKRLRMRSPPEKVWNIIRYILRLLLTDDSLQCFTTQLY